MTAKQWLEQGVAVRGSWARLKACMQRALAGESLTIGFLGGSITQGSLASDDKLCYAYRVFQWWQEKFPEADFSYVNGGIGGTSSHYGGARAQKDVLAYAPDVVIVDFSVNDEAERFFMETYEGVIRKLLAAESHPAIVIMNNVFYDDGHNAEDFHNSVGAYYGIPCISMKKAIYPMIGAGIYKAPELTPDNLHPNDLGHEYVADTICCFFDKVLADIDNDEDEPVIVEALTENAYENSCLYQKNDKVYTLDGFKADEALKANMLDLYKNGFTASKMNDRITFEIECSCLAVQYRKSVIHPVPKAMAVVDGDWQHPILLDGNFDEDWGDCLYLQTLIHHGERKKHTLEITISETHENDVRPFYLVAVIAS